MSSVKQDRAFADAMSVTIASNLRGQDGILLETAIEWIRENLMPADVFSDKELEAWAENAGYVKAQDE